jgi:NADPH:quinone reductase-like Zn-dependent oxidoreductase
MKAVLINRYGSAEVLQYADVEKPQIKSDQLLVKVHATSVNPIDWKIRKGMLKILTGMKFPMILGFDVSGEVVEVGEKVTLFKPGDLNLRASRSAERRSLRGICSSFRTGCCY